MSLNIVPYNKALLSSFVYNGVEQELSGQEIIPIIDYYAGMGDAYIAMIGNKVLGVGGMYKLWPGAAGAWLFLNKEALDHKFAIFKTLLEYMTSLTHKYETKFLIVNCLDDVLQANALLQHLGFKRQREAKMSLYTRRIK